MKTIGTIIHYDTHWETPNGKNTGTIIGYDIHHSKYKVAKHSTFDGEPMPSVIEWIFVRDGRINNPLERINGSYRNLFRSNCPVIEQTADGVEVGTCTFYMEDGKTCPRHGDINQYINGDKTNENKSS